MSIWDRFGMNEKISHSLDVQSHEPGHHFGRPFMTPYQIALRFDELYHQDVREIGKPIGGKGTGQYDSLAQYIADQLSKRIADERVTNVEGKFLYRKYLTTLQYDSGDVEASTGQSYDLSMFRLKEESSDEAG